MLKVWTLELDDVDQVADRLSSEQKDPQNRQHRQRERRIEPAVEQVLPRPAPRHSSPRNLHAADNRHRYCDPHFSRLLIVFMINEIVKLNIRYVTISSAMIGTACPT